MPTHPLQPFHEQTEAAFLPYGDELQIVESYGEMEAEYAALRKSVALMDAPHRGVVILTGQDRLAFLHNKVTNETAKLQPGQGCYAYLLNLKGRIVLDMVILHGADATLVDLDIREVPRFMSIMEKYIFSEDVQLLDATQQLARLTLMGPHAAELLHKITSESTASLTRDFQHLRCLIEKAVVTIFRQDITGEAGYELLVPRDHLVTLWQILHETGAGTAHPSPAASSGLGLRPIGWSAFNIARVEAGTPLWGIDITDNYLPMETGPWYARAVSVTKGCYLGQEIVARMHAHKTVARMLVGLRIEGPCLPVAGTEIFAGTQQVGIVTSSTLSPMLGAAPVALGYVKKAFSTAGQQVEVLAEGGRAQATVRELPLWTKSPAGTY